MSFTFGFYNSQNHDRKYDAVQLSQIFDGVIADGVYSSIGDHFLVMAPEDSTEQNKVIVGSGRAWFRHTWNYNDAKMAITGPPAELVENINRYDAIVLDINSNASVRSNQILWVKGTPTNNSNPPKPNMAGSLDHVQIPLCYIYRPGGNNVIVQGYIQNTVGTSLCPFVTGVVSTVSTDKLLTQWQSQFNDWLNHLKVELSGDVAGNLQNQIDDILQSAYPVGSIYMSMEPTSPASFIGGTWERIQGKFLLGADSTYTAGSTGGEVTHTLTVDEMPSHAHPMNAVNPGLSPSGTGTDMDYGVVHANLETYSSTAVGGGKPHNNMPPYLSVYIWKRTA